MYDVDPVALLAREVLRERLPALVAEACAWAVGLSDRPHLVHRHGRVVDTGITLGLRAEADQQLGADERVDLADAAPGSFADALSALAPGGGIHADRLDEQVLTPFVLETCLLAAARTRDTRPQVWAELLDDLGDDGADLVEVVRVAEWEAPVKTEAELLLLAALGSAPLVEVEAEGLPLSLVRAAEQVARDAVPTAEEPAEEPADLAGALFLAQAALEQAALPVPVPAEHADVLVRVLVAEGLEPDELVAVLPHLPVAADAAEQVRAAVADGVDGAR